MVAIYRSNKHISYQLAMLIKLDKWIGLQTKISSVTNAE